MTLKLDALKLRNLPSSGLEASYGLAEVCLKASVVGDDISQMALCFSTAFSFSIAVNKEEGDLKLKQYRYMYKTKCLLLWK